MDRLGTQKAFAIIRQEADQIWEFKSTDKLGYIKFCARCALNLACRDCGSEYEDYLRNPAIVDRFLKIITSIYLQAWLKNDPRAGRNIHEFYYYGYAPKVGRQTRDCPNQGISPFPFSFETLIRQNQKYKVIKSIIVKQAKADHCYYKRDRGDKKLAQQTNYARKIPWIRLCILSKMAEGKLRILDFLLERKEPLIKGLRPKSNQYLYEYYQDYYDLYRLLDPKRKNENQITDIEYVALAIMLQEMEYSYRFHAAVMFAKMVKITILLFALITTKMTC